MVLITIVTGAYKTTYNWEYHYGLWYANNELVTGAYLNQLTSLGGATLSQPSAFHPLLSFVFFRFKMG